MNLDRLLECLWSHKPAKKWRDHIYFGRQIGKCKRCTRTIYGGEAILMGPEGDFCGRCSYRIEPGQPRSSNCGGVDDE